MVQALNGSIPKSFNANTVTEIRKIDQARIKYRADRKPFLAALMAANNRIREDAALKFIKL
jgi:hypothetical protein